MTYSLVLETPAALPKDAHQHFMNKLCVETDVSDVHNDIQNGVNDFMFIDVRSSKAYEQCHASGAISLPSNQINEESTSSFSKEKLLVVYCWGPACNGATKAAARLSGLGFKVKEMIGGIEYWKKEGNPVEGTHEHNI